MRSFKNSDIIFYAIIIVVGVIHLPFPFFGDQAFFNLGAQHLYRGDIMYKDFWDIKQPGIFIFYYIGGVLFGFTEVGIHCFELIYWLVFTYVIIALFRQLNIITNAKLIPLIPVLIVVVYYLNAGTGKLTQVEAIVNFPLTLVLLTAYQSVVFPSRKNGLLLASGFAGGFVLYMKFIFLPILGVMWLVVFIYEIVNKRFSWRLILPYLFIPAGIIVAIIPFVIYAANNNMLKLVADTFFVYPVDIVSNSQTQQSIVLIEAVETFIYRIAPIIPLAIVGLISHKNKLLARSLTAYIAISILVILLQKTSWYGYHFQLLYAPLGIAFVLGLDIIWIEIKNLISKINKGRLGSFILKIAIVSCFIIPSIGILSYKCVYLIQNKLALSNVSKIKFIQAIDPYNRVAYQEAMFLKSDTAKKGDVFIMGDPLIYYHSGRYQATSLNGWGPHLLTPKLWNELRNQLEADKPVYFFIDEFFQPLINKNGSVITEFLENYYTIVRTNTNGVWYELMDNYIAVY